MSCKCQLCDKQYNIDIIVSDELWERIKPPLKLKGAGLLCGACILQKLGAIGNYNVFRLINSSEACQLIYIGGEGVEHPATVTCMSCGSNVTPEVACEYNDKLNGNRVVLRATTSECKGDNNV